MNVQSLIAQALQVDQPDTYTKGERIQQLWAGYGEIRRYHRVDDARRDLPASLIAKSVKIPGGAEHVPNHPRGWNTRTSHTRKLRSYQIEKQFYNTALRNESFRTAECFGSFHSGDAEFLILLEDLDLAGFHQRRSQPDDDEFRACISWLAHFHAQHLHRPLSQLWERGTYWHLATRRDEWAQMPDSPLKQNAQAWDEMLQSSTHQTTVHGDAKVANFCFSNDHSAQVAAVDFQYVGTGCGVQDLAYFFGSCRSSDECLRYEDEWIDEYFRLFRSACMARGIATETIIACETEWRSLYSIACADFERFLAGWCPDHAKRTEHTQKHVNAAIAKTETD